MTSPFPNGSDLSGSRSLHRETGAAWEILAKAGYQGEVDEHVALLRGGGTTLMPAELPLLGDLSSWCRRAIHLQCSGGVDLLSLWKLGARDIVGIDISETVLTYARAKAAALGIPASWFRCDVLDTPHELDGTADLVYTGRGALMWMADINAWAAVVERLLLPGGKVFIMEQHPLDNVWDPQAADFQLRADGAGYFDTVPQESPHFPASAVARHTKGDPNRPRIQSRDWRPGEVLNALAARGLHYVHFDEYPELWWDQFQIPAETMRRLPHMYSVMMRKP